MRTYYINTGNENGGPFSIDELKLQNISTATLVWYNGMDEWKYASEIEELKPFFTVYPPLIQQIESPKQIDEIIPKTIFGLKKSHFILAVLFVLIMIFVLILNIIQNNKRSILDERNKQTELGNEKVKLEQKVATEQRIQEEIQKKIVSENTNNFKKDSINGRLSEIKELLIVNKNKLRNAKNDLDATQKFQLLRSEDTKEEQINSFQNDIQLLKKQIDILESESNRLYLILETIH